MVDFFAFWVEQVWGSVWLSVFGTGAMYYLIGIMSRMSSTLLQTLMAFYLLIFGLMFGVGMSGMILYVPIFIFAMYYFFSQLYKLYQGNFD